MIRLIGPIGPAAYVAYAAVVLGQLVYWLLLRDEGRELVVWEACVRPGGAIE